MRRIIICFLLTMSFQCFGMTSDSAQVVFQQANDLYAKKDYQQAKEKYQLLVDEGLQSFEVYYNLGNAYFKSDELGPALLYYYKAQKLKPNDADVQFNIQFAERQTIDKIEIPEEFFLTSWWKSVFLIFSLSTWNALLYVSLFLALISFVLYLFINQLVLKKLGFYVGSALVVLSILFYVMGNAQYRYFNSTQTGVIYALNTTVRSTPEAGEKLFILHEGTKVQILERVEKSINIQLPNGKSGWVGEEDIREI